MTGIIVRQEGRAGRITLARPEALNALSLGMIREMDRALTLWASDPNIRLVIIDSEGDRAFCSGGDIAQVYRRGLEGDFDAGRTFFREEYVIDARIARFPKPVVTLMQGYVMGGGIGIGGHASHRVISHSTRMAMPECAIGLVPDIGGTDLLARAPGHLGEYLGLTGHRMGPGDAILTGFADHFIPEERWPQLAHEAAETGDPNYFETGSEPAPEAPLARYREDIDRIFAGPDLGTIRAALLDASTEWSRETAKILDKQCALSMAATLSLVRSARREPGVENALAREYRFTWRAAEQGELLEGIRAQIIDKDRQPRWKDSLETLSPARVDAMLAPLGENELHLPDLHPKQPPLPSGG